MSQPCPYCDGSGDEPGEPEQAGWVPPCRTCDGAGVLDDDLFCPGCHVGPDDECEAGCMATRLEAIGWSRDQARDILEGKLPRPGPVLNMVVDVTPLAPLIEVLADDA